jgi:hypothetical protein
MRPTLLCAAVLAAVPAAARPELADRTDRAREATARLAPVHDSLKRGADFLLQSQGDYKVQGKRGKVRAGWEWEIGTGDAAPNASGLVAVALLDAFAVTGDAAHLAAAEAYGGRVRAAMERAPGWRPFKPDIELLARLARLTSDARWQGAAEDAFRRVRAAAATGRDELARLVALRTGSGLVGYDAALGIRAALALGERGWATELADAAVAGAGSSWGREDDTHRVVSWGALLDVLSRLDRVRYARPIALLAEGLRLKQDAGGSWAQRETQPTAYAVLGLLSAGDAASRAAAMRGAAWLRASQLHAGGWADYNDGLPEPFVGAVIAGPAAEAVQALAAAR